MTRFPDWTDQMKSLLNERHEIEELRRGNCCICIALGPRHSSRPQA